VIQKSQAADINSVITNGDRNSHNIALTFDADMTSGMLSKLEKKQIKSLYNKAIIDILKTNNIPATIFLTGLWAKKYESVVKELAANSLFEIADHSYSHLAFTSNCYNLETIKKESIANNFKLSKETLEQISGKKISLFRFPGGCYDQNSLKLANQAGLEVIGWDLASGDAFNSNTPAIIKNVVNNAKNGSIIVFHLSGDRYAPKTAEALKVIVKRLKNKGFNFVKVSDLIK